MELCTARDAYTGAGRNWKNENSLREKRETVFVRCYGALIILNFAQCAQPMRRGWPVIERDYGNRML